MEALLEARQVSKRYGREWVLRRIELSLKPGGIVALVGPNGSGKTTLLYVLAGLLRPTRGSVLRRGQVGLLSSPPAFYRHFTGEENLLFQLRLSGLEQRRREIPELLARVGLPLGKRVFEYSSGMKKRLGLAQLLLFRPAILLLDEPEAALDAQGQELIEVLLHEQTQSGGGVVLATHDPRWWGRAEACLTLERRR
jgi:heme exporter protein A